MWIRSGAALAGLLLFGAARGAEAQEQRFRLGGGAGFAAVKNPEVDLGRTAVVGGSIGVRFNDSVSIEGGFTFARASRQFDADGVPIDESRAFPDFQFETNLYHLDSTLFFHIGRRQPFHPFVYAGGGLERRDQKRTDITLTLDENNIVIGRTDEVVLRATDYEPEAHVGGGFDLYFLYNVAARVEFRFWLPQDTEKRTRMFFFGASYYF